MRHESKPVGHHRNMCSTERVQTEVRIMHHHRVLDPNRLNMNIEQCLHVTILPATRWHSLTRVHRCSASLCLLLEVLFILNMLFHAYSGNISQRPVSITLRHRTDCWASRPFTSANSDPCGGDINLKVGLWRIDYFTGSFVSAQNVVVVQPTHIFTFSKYSRASCRAL